MFKKFLIILFVVIPFNSFALEKETTFDQQKFKKALSDGKVVVVSSWIKYCYSCASQMKVLKEAKKDFDKIEYFAFDVTNENITDHVMYIGKVQIKLNDGKKTNFLYFQADYRLKGLNENEGSGNQDGDPLNAQQQDGG